MFHCKKRGHIEKVCRAKQGSKHSKQTNHLDTVERENLYSLLTVQDKKSPGAMSLKLTLNTVPVSMELDTGAALSLINMATYHKIAQSSQLPLQKSDVMLRTYTGERINIRGLVKVNVYYQVKTKMLRLQVVEGEGPNLLGRDLLETLQVRLNGVCNLVVTINKGVDEVLTKHIKVFANELGTLTGYKAKLNVDPTAMPRFCKARTVPYALNSIDLRVKVLFHLSNSHIGQHQLFL